MATATRTVSHAQQIGETAGAVWQLLDQEGPQPLSRLVKSVDAPRDLVLQAVGWLAREDKVTFDDSGRSRVVSRV